jgi:hypothetical protein
MGAGRPDKVHDSSNGINNCEFWSSRSVLLGAEAFAGKDPQGYQFGVLMMKQRLVHKSYRIDPRRLAKAKKALGAASEAETVRMAIERVIDHEETMAVARKVMKRNSQALRELAEFDRELESDQDSWERKLGMPRSRAKTESFADLISQERSEREDALVAGLERGKVKNAGKRNNQ